MATSSIFQNGNKSISSVDSLTEDSGDSESEFLSTREVLETIANSLQIDTDGISDQKLEKKCFKKVLKFCGKGKWEKINRIHKFVPQLSDTKGRSIYDVATSKEESVPNFFDSPPENLVFKGGGPKGLAYIGVVMFLEEAGFLPNIHRIAGASAGSIIATLLAIGCSSSEMLELLKKIPESKLVDVSLFKGGLCKGEAFRQWLDTIIEKKTNIKNCTFGELQKLVKADDAFKHLHVIISKVGKNQDSIQVNSEDKKWNNLIISDVVRASISLPIVFPPHILHIKNKDGERVECKKYGTCMDGGFLKNYPIKAFDKKKYVYSKTMHSNEKEAGITNKKTLGFFLHGPKEFIDNPDTDVTWMLIGTAYYFLMKHGSEDILRKSSLIENHRMVKISNLAVKLVNFSPNKDTVDALIECGKNSSIMFLREHKQQSEILKLISEGKMPEGAGAFRKVQSYNCFRHRSSNLTVEIFGNRITIYKFSQFPVLSWFGAFKQYSFEAFIQIDERFSIFSHLQHNEKDEAQEMLEKNHLFFENCFLWDQFIKLILETDHPDYIEFFHSNGFSFKLKSSHPLWYAHRRRCWKSFEALLKIPEIDIRFRNPDTLSTQLHVLVRSGHIPSLAAYCQALPKRFPEEDLGLPYIQRALNIAICYREPKAAEVLIEHGANFEGKIEGWAKAMREKESPFFSYSIVQEGEHKGQKSGLKKTRLFQFALSIFTWDFKRSITPDLKIDLLSHCCSFKNSDSPSNQIPFNRMEKFIQNQFVPFAKQDMVDERGNGPLLIILQSRLFSWTTTLVLLKLLLSGDSPDDVNQANDKEDTPLIIAARASYDILAYLLTIPSIDVNQQDALGNTALHYAILKKGSRRCAALIKHPKIDPNIQNKLGQTPLMLAAKNDFYVLNQLLNQGEANLSLEDENGDTVLHYAVAARGRRRVQAILDHSSPSTFKMEHWPKRTVKDQKTEVQLLSWKKWEDHWEKT